MPEDRKRNFLRAMIARLDMASDAKDEDEAIKFVICDGNFLKDIPEHLRTASVCARALETPGVSGEFVPWPFRTPELYRQKLSKNGRLLEYLESPTPAECRVAVESYGCALQWVPEELKTQELCLAAFANDTKAINYMPLESDAWKMSIATMMLADASLELILPELRSPDLCHKFVRANPKNIQYVPAELVTAEIAQHAFDNNPYLLQYIPTARQTFEMWDQVTRGHREFAAVAPAHILADRRFLGFVTENPCLLKSLEPPKLTDDMLYAALTAPNLGCLCFCPASLITPELARRVLKKNGDALEYIPEALRTRDIWELALETSYKALEYIPESERTLEVCLKAAARGKIPVRLVPHNIRDVIEKYIPIKMTDELARELYLKIDLPPDLDTCVCCQETAPALLSIKTCLLPHPICTKCYASWYSEHDLYCTVCKAKFIPTQLYVTHIQ
jgi:hypothetical protein